MGKKGFDTEVIKAKSQKCDIQGHSVLGDCYRLRILTTGTRGCKGQSNEDVALGKVLKKRKFNPGKEAEDDQPAVAPHTEDESESKSSSSSSSSTSARKGKKGKKKHRRNKKDKKDKRAKREAQRKAELKAKEKADAKEKAARNKSLSKIVGKLDKPLKTLRECESKPGYSKLPTFMHDQISHAAKKLKTGLKAARDAAADTSSPMPELKDCQKYVGEANKVVGVANSWMNQIRDLPSDEEE